MELEEEPRFLALDRRRYASCHRLAKDIVFPDSPRFSLRINDSIDIRWRFRPLIPPKQQRIDKTLIGSTHNADRFPIDYFADIRFGINSPGSLQQRDFAVRTGAYTAFLLCPNFTSRPLRLYDGLTDDSLLRIVTRRNRLRPRQTGSRWSKTVIGRQG